MSTLILEQTWLCANMSACVKFVNLELLSKAAAVAVWLCSSQLNEIFFEIALFFLCNCSSSLIFKDTGNSRPMQIVLLRISLLRFFKTLQTYLANAFFGLFISLMRFFGYFWPKNRTNEINSSKNALSK